MTSLNYALPVTGQPNSTEDPKIVTALTAIESVVNGQLDTNNLSASAGITVGQLAAAAKPIQLTAISTNTTATAGNYYLVTGSSPVTVTLPTGTASGMIGIHNGTTGAAVTVAQGASAGIGILGGSGTSFQLSQQRAFATLISDGASWFCIDGQQDTGWVGVSFGTNVNQAPSDSYACAARLTGNTVTLRGQMSTTATINAGSTWATIPAGLRPAHNISAGNVSGGAGGWAVSTAGAMTLGFSVGSLNTVGMDGVVYSLS